mmetsp:Transcript_37329/g.93760  ORF Transcript_37329/g.93760 Transcript_37329/m.93760 type:complete len:336 (-) Transcript_37329:58-1065(-)
MDEGGGCFLILGLGAHIKLVLVESHVIQKAADRDPRFVELDPVLSPLGASDVIGSFGHQAENIVLNLFHAENLKVWPECDSGEVRTLVGFYQRLVPLGHVVAEDLSELQAMVRVATLDNELGGEHIGKFGSVAIAATGHLLLAVVIVVARQQVTKYKLWNVHVMLLVNDNWDALTIVHDRDAAISLPDGDFKYLHTLRVPHRIVGCIDDDLVKNFVERGNIPNLSTHNLFRRLVPDKHGLGLFLGGANICVWPQQDMLPLTHLLVGLLNGLLLAIPLRCHLNNGAKVSRLAWRMQLVDGGCLGSTSFPTRRFLVPVPVIVTRMVKGGSHQGWALG